LNADLWDGYQFSDYLDQAVKQASSPTHAGLTLTAFAGAVMATAGALSAGTLGVGMGGTGATTLTGVLTGNGAGAITANAVTQNYVIKAGAANAVGNSLIYDTGAGVVIGTTTAASLLELYGASGAVNLTITSSHATGTPGISWRTDAVPTQKFICGVRTDDSWSLEAGTGALGSVNTMVVSSAGNIGIGVTPNASRKLYSYYANTDPVGSPYAGYFLNEITINNVSASSSGGFYSGAYRYGDDTTAGSNRAFYADALCLNTAGTTASNEGAFVLFGSFTGHAGTITANNGMTIRQSRTGGGTFTTTKFLNFEETGSGATVGTGWLLYSALTYNSSLLGPLIIGANTAPTLAAVKLEVYGTSAQGIMIRSTADPILYLYSEQASANTRNWCIATNVSAVGDLVIRVSNALGGNPYSAGSNAMQILYDKTIKMESDLKLREIAAATADIAAYGQWWVRSDTPNTPMFTDDAGTDFEIIGCTAVTAETVTADRTLTVRYAGHVYKLDALYVS